MKLWKKLLKRKSANKFDELEAVSREIEVPPTPPDEFEKIMTEMDRRGIIPRIRKELKKKK